MTSQFMYWYHLEIKILQTKKWLETGGFSPNKAKPILCKDPQNPNICVLQRSWVAWAAQEPISSAHRQRGRSSQDCVWTEMLTTAFHPNSVPGQEGYSPPTTKRVCLGWPGASQFKTTAFLFSSLQFLGANWDRKAVSSLGAHHLDRYLAIHLKTSKRTSISCIF